MFATQHNTLITDSRRHVLTFEGSRFASDTFFSYLVAGLVQKMSAVLIDDRSV